MAVKAINNTAGLNSYIPILLVFSAYPYLIEYDPSTLSIIKYATIL